MKDTIKANTGYHVRKCHHKVTGEQYGKVYDGDMPVMLAKYADKDFYKGEKEGNECFQFCEVFTTIKGSQFIYWRDNEIDEDYITKIN